MKRKALSRARRLRIFNAAGGVCHICGLSILVGELWHAEHLKPLWLGGADNFDNLAPAHVRCHRGKTGDEAYNRAKSDRLRALHRGIKKSVSRPLPGTYASGIKLHMNSPPTWRDSGRPLWKARR